MNTDKQKILRALQKHYDKAVALSLDLSLKSAMDADIICTVPYLSWLV